MADPDRPTNRLAGELSPYLLLHQHNPVDWYPWGEEALARARDERKPIFLSVGYATCYWCHVMERESFADAATAELMNACFVNIKLDREERPDLDEIYMAATQLLTHQGGWPNSVFLTPDLRPFFAGTYFLPQRRHGMPSFREVLQSMDNAWRNRRDDVETQAGELESAIRRYLEERGAPSAIPGSAVVTQATRSLAQRFDADHGGFGDAPKFPTPANLYLLEAAIDAGGEVAASARTMLDATLERMARGGIHDQLGGGFHRYAVDAAWKVPHFEKMLYDNGHLLTLFARGYARTGAPSFARVVRDTAAFLDRELAHAEGGFLSAIDAETAGFEGGFHVWTGSQLRAVLGDEDFAFLAPIYGFDGPPFFEGEHYVLHVAEPWSTLAKQRRTSEDDLVFQVAPLRARLFAAREKRPRPLVDDKVLADWNGMVISGLAEAGRCLGDAALTARAARAARFVLEAMVDDAGTLVHCWRDGRRKQPALLGDYAFLVRGLLDLHAASDDSTWLDAAVRLADEQHRRLWDGERGGYFVAAAAPDLLARSREVFDGALPSANAIAALNLTDLAARTGEARFAQAADRLLRAFGHFAERQGDAARMLAVAVGHHHRETGDGADDASPITARFAVREADAQGVRDLTVTLTIAEGWHLDAPGGTGGASGAEASARGAAEPIALLADHAALDDLAWPAPAERVLAPDQPPVPVYEGQVTVTARLRDIGDGARLRLRYQACDRTRCLAPAEITHVL